VVERLISTDSVLYTVTSRGRAAAGVPKVAEDGVTEVKDYFERFTFSRAGNWLVGTGRRNPGAMLLLTVGGVLLMRRRGGLSSRTEARRRDFPASQGRNTGESYQSTRGSAVSQADAAISRAADTAGAYASDAKGRISATAGEYVDAISEYARDAGRNISGHSARVGRQARSSIQQGVKRVLREQPLAVTATGLAAGAAIAALFPSTSIEERAFGGTREALKDAASRAGQRLKTAAAERGLTTEGLKDLAGEVAGTFADAATGKAHTEADPSGASQSPRLKSEEKKRQPNTVQPE
jgi:hypothetical protein